MNFRGIKCFEDLVKANEESKTFSQAIKLKCIDCVGYELNEVKNCDIKSCPLWKFRFGKRLKENK